MGTIIQIPLSETMSDSYIEYALEVSEDRALPDVRDGLKPVHRRIITSMNELKIVPDKGYRKSARIVGDVLGKYHPHGDTAVYDAMIRLAQHWNMRYMLVDGHGNLGSIDGDSAAAMRYTEVKQSKIFQEMIRDIEKDTVDFVPNFDGEEKEPTVLPTRFPNLLVNGSDGIAVGFATKMPPHNLSEVINAINYQIDNPSCSTEELMQFIKAPDFPTYANIVNPQDILDIYKNGCGKVILRATHHIETIKIGNKEKDCIVFTDIPYQVNKSKLLLDMAEKTRNIDKIIDGKKVTIKAKIQDVESVQDESDREGMRIVVTLKSRGATQTVLNNLYKHTKIQCNYNVNNTVLIDGKPVEEVPLKNLIHYYIKHQQEIIHRRTIFDKNNSEKSLHILKGLQIAIDKLDLTIQLIRNSSSKKDAKEKLIVELNIDEIQADSILQMRLQRLTNLEKDSLLKQIEELKNNIDYLSSILNDNNVLNELLKKELGEINAKYGDDRRTKILHNVNSVIDNDLLIESYDTIVQLTNEGYIKKTRIAASKNIAKNRLKQDDFVIKEIEGNNKNILLLFSNKGNAYKLKESDLRELKTGDLGELISGLIELEDEERIINLVSTKFSEGENIIEVFENGYIAKINIQEYNKTNRKLVGKFYNTPIEIVNATSDIDILLITAEGKGLIVNSSQINAVGSRSSKGVLGIKLSSELEDNKVIGCITNVKIEDNFTLNSEKGKEIFQVLSDIAPTGGKNEERTLFTYLKGKRGNQGNFIYNCRQKNDKIINMIY